MNNHQKKLFNIANKIEKLLYDKGMLKFTKEVHYKSIDINLYQLYLNIDHDFIEPLTEITVKYNVNFKIFIKESCLTLKIW